MKKFEDIKIVAVFPAHNDDNYIDLVLNDLTKYTDEIYVNLNDATPYITNAVKSHPKVVKWIETKNESGVWSQAQVRDDTIRMLDDVKPDIVLMPDSDETYPKNLKEQLRAFWENEKYKTFWLRLVYLWGDKEHYRNDGIWKAIHHVRIFKWQSGLVFKPYRGYACPFNYLNEPRETRYNSNMPNLHWGYMTEEDRSKKFSRNGNDYINDSNYRNKADKGILILKLPNELK